MSLSAEIREQLISSFRAELAEHVQTMTDGLLGLEQHRVDAKDSSATLEDIFRAAHSLKGAARAIGVTAVEQLAHGLEDVLAAMQTDAVARSPGLFTACYHALDAIQAVQVAYEAGELTPPTKALHALAELQPFREARGDALPLNPNAAHAPQNSATPPIPETPTSTGVSAADETIRVSVGKLDALMTQLSELLITKIRIGQRATQMRNLLDYVVEWQKEWLSARSAYNRLARKQRQGIVGEEASRPDRDLHRMMTYIDASQERLRELATLVGVLSRDYSNDVMQTSLVIDALEEEIKRVRMLPLNTITATFGRMVRDLAQAVGKEATLETAGGEVELDKRVLEQIKDPLVHLLRNAIDHGIEPPETREAAGKARRGTVSLSAEQLGKDVVVTVSDDGAGLDITAIRRVAARRKGASEDVQGLSEAELAELIFYSGFSTSPIITDTSGRGVGLDVVRRNVEALGGRIDVEWQPAGGSAFRLTLPLTLTSSRGLLVRTANQVFAIPLSAIERILRVGAEQITPLGGQDTVLFDGRPIPLVRLNDVLDLPNAAAKEGRIPVVVLAAAERRIAFAVDDLVGEQEVVMKGLGKQLARVGGIAGATIMGSGEVVLILHVADLMKLATRAEHRSVVQAVPVHGVVPNPTAPRILIVDDSITTRTLEKNILEAAGYSVQLATDGQEALRAIAADGLPDLIISDIAMPRLDGFDLTAHIKGDPRTAGIPVILVTSLDSVEDKSRGIEVGADAYIVKSRFDQNNLLDTIRQLI